MKLLHIVCVCAFIWAVNFEKAKDYRIRTERSSGLFCRLALLPARSPARRSQPRPFRTISWRLRSV